MSREEQIKARTKELSALVDQLQTGKLTAVEAIMAAYKIGNDDAMAHVEERFASMTSKLRAKP